MGFCGLLAATALFLRIRADYHERGRIQAATSVNLAAPESCASSCPSMTGDAVSIPVAPRDYVLHPDVVAGEEQRGPKRIISLAPSITETLCALGLANRLAGRTQFCKYPPQIAGPGGVPAVGGIMDTNLEMIRVLQPDLVLTTANSGDVGSKLDALGLRHVSLPHDSLEDVFTCIERIGEVCDRPKTACRLVSAIRADLERLQAASPAAQTRSLRVLMVCGNLPVPPTAVWVVGPHLFLDTLLRAAGHQNAAADLLAAPFGEVPLERLVALDPDVILTFPDPMPSPADVVTMYRSWSPLASMQAIRRQRVCPVGGAEWLSAGPRVAVELHRFITVLGDFR